MRKIKLIKEKDLAVSQEIAECYCDFCGEGKGQKVFTSSFADSTDSQKWNMQICENCIKQLSKLIKSND